MDKKDWIRTYLRQAGVKGVVSVNQLEVQAGLPRGTLNHFLNGIRDLPDQYIELVLQAIQKLSMVTLQKQLMDIGFLYEPNKEDNSNGTDGSYRYSDPRARFVLEIKGRDFKLWDGRPGVSKLWYSGKDMALSYIVRLLIKFSKEQYPKS